MKIRNTVTFPAEAVPIHLLVVACFRTAGLPYKHSNNGGKERLNSIQILNYKW